LLAALSGWQIVARHLEEVPSNQGRREADPIQRNLPRELWSAPGRGQATSWTVDSLRVRRAYALAIRVLIGWPTCAPSLRLLADQASEVLVGISYGLNGLALLVNDPARRVPRRHIWFQVPDWLPAAVNAVRAFVTIGAVEIFWTATAWPNGAEAITYSSCSMPSLRCVTTRSR
jgi:hypothetical protein